MSNAIGIKFVDLMSKARAGKLADIVEREIETTRLVRLLLRPSSGHVAIVGEPGSGKTSLTEALAWRCQQGRYGSLPQSFYRLDTEPVMSLLINNDSLRQCLQALREATTKLPGAIIVIEDIQLLATDDPGRLELTLALLKSLASHQGIKLIVTTTPSAYHRIFRDDYTFNRTFDALELAEPEAALAQAMVEQALSALERHHHLRIEDEAVVSSVEYGGRFKHGRALPDTALRLLEEACVQASIDGLEIVTAHAVQEVVAERERLPLSGLDTGGQTDLSTLESKLATAVVGQNSAIRTIARTIAKSQLGLGDSSKPRGSFLLLGPSGVGKTETAKAIATHVYSNPQALVRLDMSEYSEPHAAIRLIGSPPGYVGYEEGGQLTGAVSREPYSLILLDEIEKAHPKLFDLFLQLLDDGRLTDSGGVTVDFTETTVLATSNVGAHLIAESIAAGIDVHSSGFMLDHLMPLLMTTYRPEFINRFDGILVYEPLGEAQLVRLAQRELAKLAGRLERLGVTFNVSDETLSQFLRPMINPLFGARPVKRMVATHFETPIASALIAGTLESPVVITGTEAWLRAEVTS